MPSTVAALALIVRRLLHTPTVLGATIRSSAVPAVPSIYITCNSPNATGMYGKTNGCHVGLTLLFIVNILYMLIVVSSNFYIYW